jgi:anti-anti-sigma factor
MGRQRSPDQSFTCLSEPVGSELILRIAGDVDLASRPLLLAHLRQAVARRRGLTVDLTRVSYMDSTGVRTLEVATEPLRRVTILVRPGGLSRLLVMLLDERRFTIRQEDDSPGSSPAE